MELTDYIKIIPNVLDHKFCSALINKDHKYQMSTLAKDDGTAYTDTGIRNCLSSTLLNDDDSAVYDAVGKVNLKYRMELKGDCNLPRSCNDSGYDLLKYEEGEYFSIHVDDLRSHPRRLSISLSLNEEYEGGEFQFFGNYKVSASVGSAIIFPSNFCFPHEVLPVKSGTRYSIVTWLF